MEITDKQLKDLNKVTEKILAGDSQKFLTKN